MSRNLVISIFVNTFNVTVQLVPAFLFLLVSQADNILKQLKFCRKKSMTSAAFSADGSVLAVAAESVITLWDPDNNALVGVIAETLSVSDYT